MNRISTITAAALAALLATVGTAPASEGRATPIRADGAIALVNHERAQRGLPALRRSAHLDAAAQGHVNWMVRTGQVSHTGARGTRVPHRAQAVGYRPCYAGETIAYGPPTQEIVVRAWMNSPSHKRVIVSAKAGDVGVAAARDARGRPLWVMVTGTRCG